MSWIRNNALWIGLAAFLVIAVGGITFSTLILKRHADVIRGAAKAPPPAAEPAPVAPTSPAVDVPLPPPPKRKPRVGPASSKDCAGLTVAKCAAKRRAACEKQSGGKACIASKGHW